MNKKKITTLTVLFFAGIITMKATAQQKPFDLVKNWELVGFSNPESVVLNEKNNVLYVSNVNGAPTDKDGNGYISKVSTDGKIIEQKWVTGLDAPKGIDIYKNKLYVADITNIVEIDIVSGKILAKYAAPGATFLNDIAIDKKGNVFASNTFGFSGIYKLTGSKVELWLKSDELNMPNGLLAENNKLLVAGWGDKFHPENYTTDIPGKVVSISYTNKSINNVTTPAGNLDGLTKTLHGYLLSDWLAGKLIYNTDGTSETIELLDLPQGSADIFFSKKTKTVFIPLMNDNKLLSYSIKK